MSNKLSVIVPVYNSKVFLERCFLSLLNQTYKNIQIIFVDDGSSDGSAEICDSFIEKYSDIKVIHTKNYGVSHARNVGISNSDGDLIAFLDSDDYVSPSFYEKLINRIPKFAFGTIIVDDGKSFKTLHEKSMELFVKTPFDISYFIVGDEEKEIDGRIVKTRIFGSIWRSIFQKKTILDNGILFDERLTVGEDLIFLLTYLKYINEVASDEAEYFYSKIDSSATSILCGGYLPNFSEKYQKLTDSILKCISDSKMSKIEKKRTSDYQKMKFCLSFVVNELSLSNKKTNNLSSFFKKQENKDYLHFSIESIKELEHISARRAILLFLIKHKMWQIVKIMLRLRKHGQ